jgi:hypothetical protein
MKRPTPLLLAFLAAACGDDGAADTADAASADAVSAGACDIQGLASGRETAERDDELGVLFYTASSGSAPMIDRMTLDFYFELGASDGPHNFTFSGEELADCHTCLLLYRGCSDTSCASARTFLAEEGQLEIDSMGPAGTNLKGTLTGASLREVTIDFGTQESTPVPGGEAWCIESHAFDLPITAP